MKPEGQGRSSCPGGKAPRRDTPAASCGAVRARARVSSCRRWGWDRPGPPFAAPCKPLQGTSMPASGLYGGQRMNHNKRRRRRTVDMRRGYFVGGCFIWFAAAAAAASAAASEGRQDGSHPPHPRGISPPPTRRPSLATACRRAVAAALWAGPRLCVEVQDHPPRLHPLHPNDQTLRAVSRPPPQQQQRCRRGRVRTRRGQSTDTRARLIHVGVRHGRASVSRHCAPTVGVKSVPLTQMTQSPRV